MNEENQSQLSVQLSALPNVTEDAQLSCVDGKQPLHKRYTKNQIVLAIGRNKGIKSAVCRELDCSVYQLNHWLNIHSDVKPIVKEAKQELVALAEEKLMLNLNSENEKIRQQAVEFILKHIGKDEGWDTSPNVQVNIASDDEIKLQINNIFSLS